MKVKHNDDLTSKDFYKFEAWTKVLPLQGLKPAAFHSSPKPAAQHLAHKKPNFDRV